jgi:hypothetical protein
MKQFRPLLFLVLIAASLMVAQDQSSTATGNVRHDEPTATSVAEPPIRTLTPGAGQTLAPNSVDLPSEVVPPTSEGEPSSVVQLDGTAPTSDASKDSTSELQPSSQSIQVSGRSAVVRKAPQAARKQANSFQAVAGLAPTLPIPPELRNDGDLNLPMAGSPLPVLSLIGFGLLIGGAAHTMRKHKS